MPAKVSTHERLEKVIAEYFNREHCVLTGSGTAAMYCCFAVFKGASEPGDNPEILYPSITCETAVHAGIFAGFTPVFCDISMSDFTADGVSIRESLHAKSLKGVVPTHIFGHIAASALTPDYAGEGKFVVEDAAQGFGGQLNGNPVGALAAASIISFGDGKILDCGGGGAVLTDDAAFESECRKINDNFNIDADVSDNHRRDLLKEMVAARRADIANEQPHVFFDEKQSILFRHRDGYLTSCSNELARAIAKAFPGLREVASRRLDMMYELDEFFATFDQIEVPRRHGRPALWRYTFLADADSRDEIVSRLQREKLSVSKLFPPCGDKFRPARDDTPAASEFSQRVINIRVPETTEELSILKSTFARNIDDVYQ